MENDFKMPKVNLGEMVYWYGDADVGSPPMAALVTEVGDKGITVAIIEPTSYNLQPQSGVPHADDPRVKQLLDRDAGCWKHGDCDRRTPAQPAKNELAKS